MAQRRLFKLSKYCGYQHRATIRCLNNEIWKQQKRNKDSRPEMVMADGVLRDAGEVKKIAMERFGIEGKPGERDYPYVRKTQSTWTLEDWHLSTRGLGWTLIVCVWASYLYYIRKKQKLWMRTDHPEYYANHPMNRKNNNDNTIIDDTNNDNNDNIDNNENENENETTAEEQNE